jgi:hypothetical protein
MKDEQLKRMLHQSHGWQADGETWVYGVAIPNSGADPSEVADKLTELGVTVLPGRFDDSPIPANAVSALAKHGVHPNHSGHEAAQAMHAACGMPCMKPHLF